MIDPIENPTQILTPQEVADYLRTDAGTVLRMIADDEIPSFDISGEPRVQAGALVVWFQEQVRLKNLDRLRRRLLDKTLWAAALREEPSLRLRVSPEALIPGTFGAILKDAASLPELGVQSDGIADVDKVLGPRREPRSTPESENMPLSKGQVIQVVNRYIGVAGGYLGDFSYRTHADFYPEYCNLDCDPSNMGGTTRERFITIMGNAPTGHQARILRGVVARFPVGQGPPTRTAELRRELLDWADRLEGAADPRRFTVAFSFPGEHREYVRHVDEHLCQQLPAEAVFYDERFKHELARPDLDTYLQEIYHQESRLVVVFFCKAYAEKEWCGLEWRAIRDIIKQRRAAEVMPFRFDDARVPGVFSVDGYIDAREHDPKQSADLILRRLEVPPKK